MNQKQQIQKITLKMGDKRNAENFQGFIKTKYLICLSRGLGRTISDTIQTMGIIFRHFEEIWPLLGKSYAKLIEHQEYSHNFQDYRAQFRIICRIITMKKSGKFAGLWIADSHQLTGQKTATHGDNDMLKILLVVKSSVC